MYSIKGLVAYYYHAEELRKLNPNTYSEEERKSVYNELFEISAGLTNAKPNLDGLISLNMQLGKLNFKVM